MGIFDFLKRQTTEFKFNNKTLRIAVKNWCENEISAIKKYGHISQWDTSEVTNMAGLFLNADKFNSPIGNWDVSNVTDMNGMFDNAYNFNQDISLWNVSKVNDMGEMFSAMEGKEIIFNQPIENWDVSNVTNMEYMFCNAKFFNHPIENWNVSNVVNMEGMFSRAESFNQPIGKWDVSKVINMKGIFATAKAFNQPIGNWNVGNVNDMNRMFIRAVTFNQSLENWNVSKVNNMEGMFSCAESFNQPIGNWDVSNVTNMKSMFAGAESFNQLLENWNVKSTESNLEDMFMGMKSYDKPIPSWYIHYSIFTNAEIQAIKNEITYIKNKKNNFDSQIEKIKIELSEMKEETNSDLYDYTYWFDIVYNRVEAYSNSYLDNFDNENINDLSDGHCEEYRYKMIENDDIEKVEFITPRIICFAIIYEKLLLIDENDFTNEDLLRLDVLIFHSLSSLYGGIKFALQNIKEGQSLVNKLYPNYDLNLIEKSIKKINDKAEIRSLNLLPSDLRLNLNHLMKSKIQENILQKNTQEYELLIELIDTLFFIDVENTEIKNIKDSTKCLIESLNKEEIYWLIRFFHDIIKYSKQYYYFELIISIIELINEFEIEITNSLFDEIIDLRSSFEIIKTLKNNLKLYNYVLSIKVRMKMGHFKTQQNLADILNEEFMLDNYIDNATEELGFSGEKFEKILEMTFAAKMMTFDIEYLSEILNEHEENKFYGYDYIDEIFSTYGIIYESLKKNIFS